jgi:serine/threonine protein kinase
MSTFLTVHTVNCVQTLKDLFRQMAAGVAALQSMRIVHCNLRSSNMLVGDRQKDGRYPLKIGAFRLAVQVPPGLEECPSLRHHYAGVHTSMATGTAISSATQWDPPETHTHGTFSFMTDVWSLGMTIVETLRAIGNHSITRTSDGTRAEWGRLDGSNGEEAAALTDTAHSNLLWLPEEERVAKLPPGARRRSSHTRTTSKGMTVLKFFQQKRLPQRPAKKLTKNEELLWSVLETQCFVRCLVCVSFMRVRG